ncbi:forespore capture DNA-binding protein RefZ [Caenibacillus caldisaponilyticus]|uniref:forespore capture DNA-binding protein RefZ n=1 Tax=Caenibacillus caldisaponilyticus TaxID=1674942 RepID=UPI00098890FD|nr:forespore capture DNA-binding protein RefZ [Caenibacillus caldisaponilyticus]
MRPAAKKRETKQAVMDAAARLFHMYGYHGTSVRAIAEEAGVNVALISYYFGGKKALLEHLMENFYEGYLRVLETAIRDGACLGTSDLLYLMAERLIQYQHDRFYVALFVHREVTVDSTLVRELMTTYLMKEKYLFENVFAEGLRKKDIRPLPVDFLILQFREMIIMPFLQPLYLRRVHALEPTRPPFLARYLRFVKSWTASLSPSPSPSADGFTPLTAIDSADR